MDQLVGTYTAKVSKSDVYEAVGRTVYNDLTDGKSDLTVWFDGVETPVKTADVEDYVERNNTGAVNNTANGDLTEIYVDDDTNDVTMSPSAPMSSRPLPTMTPARRRSA